MAVVSLNPDTFVETGLLDDADVEITDIMFTPWNYGGKGPNTLALGVEFTEINPQADGTRKKHEQYYSAGDPEFFRPSADGAYLEPISDRTAMNSNTNAAQFLLSAVKSGVPKSMFDTGSCKVLKGLRAHVNRVAQPKRAGLKKSGDDDKERSVLLISRVISLPGQGMGAAIGAAPSQQGAFGTASPAPTPAPVASSPFGGVTHSPASTLPPPVVQVAAQPTNGQVDIVSAAAETLMGILAANGGRVAKKELPLKAFQATTGNPLQGQIVSKVFEDQFLMTCPGVKYDGAVVSF